MKRVTIGILAHVDAGKTTLSEGMLYESGKIRTLGRVDNKNAYFDTNEMERERGITIFSKQAVFCLGESEITLLDTPGHVDFSAEMERTLQVLDYAILVISGADGVQGHTLTLWKLLERYRIPAFLFVNKMDQNGVEKEGVLNTLQEKLSDGCVDFSTENDGFFEEIAMLDEETLEQYLENGIVEREVIAELIFQRKVHPVYFGSALKVEGVREFLQGLDIYTKQRCYGEEFAATVFKIARDEQNNRLTYMKITGGALTVRQGIEGRTKEEQWSEKVHQIRSYSGEKYEIKNQAEAGEICAVTGLTKTYPGQGLGVQPESEIPLLEPVLTYSLCLPCDTSPNQFLPKLRQIEEEEPELKVVWKEESGQILVQLMGEVQIQVLRKMIWERFNVDVQFGEGKIVYKETIRNTVEGVGHFEPLRHYAEVHLLLEPGEQGSGVQVHSTCSEDILSKNWQRLIKTHIEEKEHSGVLTGSAITDIRITLVAGRAHLKHTEGGDFRQATYRAIRQGLMKAESCLLEPYYEFILELPAEHLGRAMMDIEKMQGELQPPEQSGEKSILRGIAPAEKMQNYQQQVQSYTKGMGQLVCNLKGYFPCHNEEEVLEKCQYDAEADVQNPSASVFCSHGAGFLVPWYEVEKHMHLPLMQNEQAENETNDVAWQKKIPEKKDFFVGEEEIEEIFARTYAANQKPKQKAGYKKLQKRTITAPVRSNTVQTVKKNKEKYLLVDGYNIVFAWEELRRLAKENIDSARDCLMDILCNYQAYKKCTLILVFDAYRVKGNIGQMYPYHNIHVVYTKEAETADQYIEKLAHKMGKEYDVTVATSDGLEQLIIRGQGCHLLSAHDFYAEVKRVEEIIRENL